MRRYDVLADDAKQMAAASGVTQTSADRYKQRAGALTQIVRPSSRAARIEIEIDTELAEPSEFSLGPRVRHAMDLAQ